MTKLRLQNGKKIILINGPSGVGKSTIIDKIIEKSEFKISHLVSITTRSPRPGEIDGIDRHFISEEHFQKLRDNNELIEDLHFKGNNQYYGITKNEVLFKLEDADFGISDGSVDGLIDIKKHIEENDLITILIKAKSREILRERMQTRGHNSAEEIEKRMTQAEEYYNNENIHQHIVINENLNNCVNEILEILKNSQK